ncbi:hypothetical protein LTR96_011902 [Exophiala xenobiotica]|nr:hypothetical protein LTR96_011902 [Exophiala xenobiotica]
MTLAVRGVVELFRLVKREQELHQEILAFSISHDNETVRIYGHYPVIEGKKTSFYRHTIRKFDFTEQDGLESHNLSDSGATGDDELRLLDTQEVTPETSVTQTSEQATFKKPKKR